MLTIVSVYCPCEECLFADRTMQEVIDLKNPFELYNRVRYIKYIFLLPILQFKKAIAEAAIILKPFEFSRWARIVHQLKTLHFKVVEPKVSFNGTVLSQLWLLIELRQNVLGKFSHSFEKQGVKVALIVLLTSWPEVIYSLLAIFTEKILFGIEDCILALVIPCYILLQEGSNGFKRNICYTADNEHSKL